MQWFQTGLGRQPWATAFALLASYTGVVLSLWASVLGFGLGAVVGTGVIQANSITRSVGTGSGGAVTILSVAGSAIVSAAIAFAAVYSVTLVHAPLQWITSLVGGALLAVLTVAIIARFEGDLLVLRGYRRPSRDEARRLAPVVQAVGTAMRLGAYPRFCVWDTAMPGAWTHMRHIVVSTGLLDALQQDELEAVIAHEMHHWRRGDSVSLRIVWAAGLPVSLLYNLGSLLAGRNKAQASSVPPIPVPSSARQILGYLGWVFLWPTWIIMKLVIGPTVATQGRRQEYEADAAAAQIGRSEALISALRQIAMFEPGRSGWEQVLMASHPPTELRIEALQAARPDDADYQEGPLAHVLIKVET